MPADIRVPEMGESIVEATVGKWLKREGDPVAAGEPVVELETEKVNLEVSASQDGVLEKVLKREGETVNVGDVLGVIAERAAVAAPQPAPPREARAEVTEAPAGDSQAQVAPEREAEAREEDQLATPLARRMAAEQGVDLSRVPGTGRGGRITHEDVEEYLRRVREQRAAAQPEAPARPAEAVPAAPPPPAKEPEAAAPPAPPAAAPRPGRYEERVRLSRRRLTIARRLVEAQQTAAMLTTFNEVDMTGVMELRSRWRGVFKEKHGTDLGFMPFFVKAVVGALKAFPEVNSEIQGNELVLKYYYDIGIAIGAEEGLVVPVLRDADKKSFADIEAAIADMVKRSRERKLTLEELEGGTFTITNGGVFGSLLSTPILNPPQVGILGMHRIMERPVVVNGQVVVRPMMYLALTYDHRVVDGRQAVQFLVRVKELVEDPSRLMLDI